MVASTQQKQPEAPVEAKAESHTLLQMARPRVLVYLLRRDLRVSDNPIFHHLVSSQHHGFTHVLPIYVFSPHQIEVSGFLEEGAENPFPEARGRVGKYWRCGPHRAAFIGQAVWDVKKALQDIGSDLVIRVGKTAEVVRGLVEALKQKDLEFGALWMVGLEGTEEQLEEKALASICKAEDAGFNCWIDEKYFIDDRDVGLSNPNGIPDVFTTFRKSVEPLREKPRASLPAPQQGSLPSLPESSAIAAQPAPFKIPASMTDLVEALVKPVKDVTPGQTIPFPPNATSAHPFQGGESFGLQRLDYMIRSGGMKRYKETRNEMVGSDFSTKLSAYLALGCITARQVHHAVAGYEDGTNEAFKHADGFGQGENEGTKAVRFELLWRDYMRLCHQKYSHKMFRLEGFKGEQTPYKDARWKTPNKERAAADQDPTPERVAYLLQRFNYGSTGMGLIDASQRELLHTGYTSNRARQNVASFLSKHLGIDWRYGAEWYEMLLVDYDVSSNWANWQYVSGVGNDPRGEMRIFNPIKQAFDYDQKGTYVRSWVPELSTLSKLENVFQVSTTSEDDLRAAGLENNIMVTDPAKRIEFSVAGKPFKPGRRPYFRRGNRSHQTSGSPPNSEAAPPAGAGDVQPAQSLAAHQQGGAGPLNPNQGQPQTPPSGWGRGVLGRGRGFVGSGRGNAPYDANGNGGRGRGHAGYGRGVRGRGRGVAGCGEVTPQPQGQYEQQHLVPWRGVGRGSGSGSGSGNRGAGRGEGGTARGGSSS
ncbi:hypothetical protein OQA88_4736 [Cercophora sp. LCS_1]